MTFVMIFQHFDKVKRVFPQPVTPTMSIFNGVLNFFFFKALEGLVNVVYKPIRHNERVTH